MFGNIIEIVRWVKSFELLAGAVDQADIPIIQFQAISGCHHAEITGGEDCELVDVLHVLFRPVFHYLQAGFQGFHGCVHAFKDFIPFAHLQGFVDTARYSKIGVDAPPGQGVDNFLSKFAQLHSLDGQSGVGANQPDHVAGFGRAIESEQQIRPGQFEEVHAVALDDLSHVHQFAQQIGRMRGGLPGQGIVGFG